MKSNEFTHNFKLKSTGNAARLRDICTNNMTVAYLPQSVIIMIIKAIFIIRRKADVKKSFSDCT